MNRKRWFAVLGLALILPANARAAGASSGFSISNHLRMIDVITTIVENHVLEFALLALSVVALALTIERFYTLVLGGERIMPDAPLSLVRKCKRQQKLDESTRAELQRACRNFPSAYSTVVEHCLLRSGDSLAVLATVGTEALEAEFEKASRTTNHLALVGRLGPYLGLLGTVLGMMVAFFNSGSAETGRNALLAQGLATALGTTAEGILLTIVASAVAHFMRQRLKTVFTEMKSSVFSLLPLLAEVKSVVSRRETIPLNGRAEHEFV